LEPLVFLGFENHQIRRGKRTGSPFVELEEFNSVEIDVEHVLILHHLVVTLLDSDLTENQ